MNAVREDINTNVHQVIKSDETNLSTSEGTNILSLPEGIRPPSEETLYQHTVLDLADLQADVLPEIIQSEQKSSGLPAAKLQTSSENSQAIPNVTQSKACNEEYKTNAGSSNDNIWDPDEASVSKASTDDEVPEGRSQRPRKAKKYDNFGEITQSTDEAEEEKGELRRRKTPRGKDKEAEAKMKRNTPWYQNRVSGTQTNRRNKGMIYRRSTVHEDKQVTKLTARVDEIRSRREGRRSQDVQRLSMIHTCHFLSLHKIVSLILNDKK